MKPKRIVVLGGGFAGLWSAVGAARKRQELGMGPGDMAITLVNRDAYHSIRVRNYEADLAGLRVPLNDILGPIGVEWVEGEVSDLDYLKQEVSVAASQTTAKLVYDRLVFALGSRLDRPNIPGLAEHTFDVDPYEGALRLDAHYSPLTLLVFHQMGVVVFISNPMILVRVPSAVLRTGFVVICGL